MEMIKSLEAFINADYDAQIQSNGTLPQETDKFSIQTQEQADWAVRKIARIEHSLKEAEETAKKEIDKINEWLTGQQEHAVNEKEFFVNLLEVYHRKIIRDNPKQKTIKLPHGNLQLRAQQPEFAFGENLLTWVKQNSLPYVEVQEKLKWGELKENLIVKDGKAILKETGEIVEDITVTERDTKFSVKVVE